MNILLLSQFFSENKGGVEYLWTLMIRLLADDGHNIWIITNKIKNETYPHHKNVNIVFVPPTLEHKGIQPTGFKENISYIMFAVAKGIKIINKERIDIIHSNSFAPTITGAILSTLTSKPHITILHDVVSLYPNFWKMWGMQEKISPLAVSLAPILEKLLIRLKCAAIHTVSETSREDLIKLGAKKPIYVIHNAIEIPKDSNEKPTLEQFIFIGRIVFYKNLEVVIKAINLLKHVHPKIKLVIIGEGPHKKKLEEMVRDLNLNNNVEFRGRITTSEKIKCVSTSQALVFPSTLEGFGIVILEAYAARKPVLVSDIRPMSDIVIDKKTGFVLPPYDEKKWAETLEFIINEPEKANLIGIEGRKILEEKYTIKKMLNGILKMYHDFVK